tara:strand:+ start:20945 stop:21685 length:741 start_codon:yes stop_codon:yes gene_type:complete
MPRQNTVALSGLVLCQNNASTIGHVIDNLLSVCEEVVIVDGGSSDNTIAEARKRPQVKVVERKFDNNFGAQRNAGLEVARGKWILSLDTDELMTKPGLRRLRYLTMVPGAGWWSIPRYWLVPHEGGVGYIAGPTFYRDRQVRLIRNVPEHRFAANRVVHEHLNTRKGLGRPLRGPHIFHYAFLMQDRATRERKFEYYMGLQPELEHVHRMYLWEDLGEEVKPLAEKLPGMLPGASIRSQGSVQISK